MRSFLYLTMAAVDATSGVYKKIIEQFEAFTKQNLQGQILFVSDNENAILFKNDKMIPVQINNILLEIKEYLENSEFCYVRFELLRHKNYKKILDICMKCGTKIITEIPTFPPYQESLARVRAKKKERKYLGALKTLIGAAFVVFDMYRIAKFSDMVCIVADDYKFKKTKTIRIENGVNIRKNPYVESRKHENINVIAVSNFAVWNGYDRAIEGIKKYKDTNPKIKVNLIFVGPLANAPELQKRVDELSLHDCIEFTGALSGSELDVQYGRADMALGALGNHRRKVFANSSLKAKEYAARGMIMVLSDAEGIEKEILESSYVVKSDESPIDFSAIVAWYTKIQDKKKMRDTIHEYAVAHYSWDNQIRKILAEFYRRH